MTYYETNHASKAIKQTHRLFLACSGFLCLTPNTSETNPTRHGQGSAAFKMSKSSLLILLLLPSSYDPSIRHIQGVVTGETRSVSE